LAPLLQQLAHRCRLLARLPWMVPQSLPVAKERWHYLSYSQLQFAEEPLELPVSSVEL
jgi:hypothetical protein